MTASGPQGVPANNTSGVTTEAGKGFICESEGPVADGGDTSACSIWRPEQQGSVFVSLRPLSGDLRSTSRVLTASHATGCSNSRSTDSTYCCASPTPLTGRGRSVRVPEPRRGQARAQWSPLRNVTRLTPICGERTEGYKNGALLFRSPY